MDRRTFFSWIARAAKGTATGLVGIAAALRLEQALGRVEAAPAAQSPIRPPGSLSENDFRALCTRCFLCGQVCPADCIAFPNRIEGAQPPLLRAPGAMERRSIDPPVWEADDTPFILPWKKACAPVDCMQCGEVCPTGAIRSIRNDKATIGLEVKMGVALIDRKICLPWTRTSWCGACFTICPWRDEAITVDYQGRPTIHAESCTGCGLCVELCPIRYKAIAIRPPFKPDYGMVRAE